MATTSPSIKLIRASDGSGNASAATVQNTRSPGATTIQVDTVQGIPDNFYASMGTPHTFTDPVTGETITVISEASAVDFEGHVDGTNLEIDAIAAGYTDAGSAVGDIVIIRPTTPYANNIADVLDVSHNDDGTFKDDSISDPDMFTDALNPVLRDSEKLSDFVVSGGIVAQSAGLLGTFSNIIYYVAGARYTASSIANKTYLASKDTYVDIGIDGVVDYNDVANGATPPALAANHIRIAKVVTNGSAITSVTQTGIDAKGGNFFRPLTPIRTNRIINPVAFDVFRAAAMTSSNTIIFDSVNYDLGNNYNTANGRFTAPVTGIYHFDAHSGNTVAASTNIYIEARINGVAKKNGSVHNSPGAPNHSMFSGDFLLTAGDYVEFYLVGGGGSVVSVGQQNTFANGHLVSIV